MNMKKIFMLGQFTMLNCCVKENWTKPEEAWLGWTTSPDTRRAEAARLLCHVFTERPIYRPDDPVHIKGYVRKLDGGLLTPSGQGDKVEVVVSGPDDAEWRHPVTVEANGSLHYLFDDKTDATERGA